MEHKETGCQPQPEAPVLCANNCGFFGSAATMNLCSKCHKDQLLKQEQAKLVASSIGSILNGNSSSSEALTNGIVVTDIRADPTELVVIPKEASLDPMKTSETMKVGPSRCSTCKKRVGMTGFNCRCGNLFCAAHRYSDKHDCPFDYRTAGRDAIAKVNPIVKAEKLGKI